LLPVTPPWRGERKPRNLIIRINGIVCDERELGEEKRDGSFKGRPTKTPGGGCRGKGGRGGPVHTPGVRGNQSGQKYRVTEDGKGNTSQKKGKSKGEGEYTREPKKRDRSFTAHGGYSKRLKKGKGG